MKKSIYLFCLLFIALLIGCGKKQETEVSLSVEETVSAPVEKSEVAETVKESEPEVKKAEIIVPVTFSTDLLLSQNTIEYLPGYEPEKIYASSFADLKNENPFSIYDGYYSFADDNGYSCYVTMKDGFVTMETRGEKYVGTETEMYIQDDHAYVELDGDIIQLGKRDMYTLEYAKDNLPWALYLNYYEGVDAEVCEFEISRVKRIMEEEEQEKRAAIEEQKKADEEEAARKKAEEEAASKAEKEKEEKLAKERSSSGWTKGKVVSWSVDYSYVYIEVEVIETNCSGISAGDIIAITADEFDDCLNEFGELYDYFTDGGIGYGGGNGVSFEMTIDKHKCGDYGYRVVKFLG